MRGTDVHPYYQRGLNWKAAPDIHFAWVKVSDGGAPYSTVQQGVKYVPDTHVAGAKAAGIPVGGYHYAQLRPSPEAQADVLLGEVRRLGATRGAPMLDLEAPFTPDATAKNFGIAFCKRLAAAGVRPAVYMNASFAATVRPDQWNIPGLVIVIARYGARPEAPGSGRYVGRYDVHQYSSTGTLPGSAGLVDLDESYTNAHLTIAQEDDVISEDDFNNLMWKYRFDDDGKGHTGNFAQAIKGMRDTLGQLVGLVGKGTGATAADVAAALLPALTAAMVAEVAKVDAISDEDAAQIAEAVTARAGALLGGGQ
jgi:hypothetical protein